MKQVLLVIDDNEDYRHALVGLCQAHILDVHVLTATHGAEGLKLAAAEKPGVVVLDIQLPDMDGFEICRRLKADPATATAHVLMMSDADVDQADRIHGMQTGADGYLRKPFEAMELLLQIQALLRWRALETSQRDQLEALVTQRTATVKEQERTAELQAANRALQVSEERYQGVVTNILDALYSVDGATREFRYVSPAFERLCGYTLAEVQQIGGRQAFLMRVSQGNNFTRQERIIEQLIKQQMRDTPTRHEMWWRCKDGTLKCVEDSWAPVFDGERLESIHGILRDITGDKHIEQQIADYQKDLRALTSELLLAEENERKRIAGTLHDSVGQMLVVLKLNLDVAAQDASRGILLKSVHKAVAMLETIIQQIRTLTTDISPPVLYELGLIAALEWVCERFQAQSGVHVSFRNQAGDVKLDMSRSILLFQSVRELLANIGKHAKARHAIVTLKARDQQLVVMVEDDGLGFDSQALLLRLKSQDQSFGFFSIRERMTHLDGTLLIESEDGVGTTVTMTVPVKATATREEGSGDEHKNSIGG